MRVLQKTQRKSENFDQKETRSLRSLDGDGEDEVEKENGELGFGGCWPNFLGGMGGNFGFLSHKLI